MKNQLFEKFQNKRIILASGSPRRRDLLKGLDIPFTVETKEVDEVYPEHLVAGEITRHLAKLKADAFVEMDSNTIIITADTIVWLDEKAVMKPRDRGEAIEIIGRLSDKCHKVYTSVFIKSAAKTKMFTDCTKVYFDILSKEEIAYYVDKYQPYDKAGGYGAQDWIGYIAIKKLEGSYFNVMGLPVHKLYRELISF